MKFNYDPCLPLSRKRQRFHSPLREWQHHSLIAAGDNPHWLFPLADESRVPRLVKKYPHLFEHWTAADFAEAELRFWFRYPNVMLSPEQLYRAIATVISRRGRPVHLDFSESLDDCQDVPRIIAGQKARMVDIKPGDRDFVL